MSDVFTKKKRSEVMSRIRGRGNKETELVLASLLRKSGLRGWKRHMSLVGKPDFTFPKSGLAIFVDGCFWHLCPLHSNMPVRNRSFWSDKLRSNKVRDRVVNRLLKKMGWRVLRIWEHELKRPQLVRKKILHSLR